MSPIRSLSRRTFLISYPSCTKKIAIYPAKRARAVESRAVCLKKEKKEKRKKEKCVFFSFFLCIVDMRAHAPLIAP